ncbi:nucleotidyltransferase family protein [Chitinimonas sp. BJYL2]|uniref:nucleotidyltransferase family protein n=1 Tax=Chitinimonas sp. BJYL2 TaxID=2976696 RepID=UPI0022B2F942|nr:nucleotidyltransferase family protein [Chitinimonas sp. BJYL2]
MADRDSPTGAHATILRDQIAATPWLMAALRAARTLDLPHWCIAAGAVRNLVWERAHDRDTTQYSGADIDLLYFDDREDEAVLEMEVSAKLQELAPDYTWEPVNQAQVHLWYADVFGESIAPCASLADGMARWPETATAVGVWLDADDALQLIAPLGLDDLYSLTLRHNRHGVSRRQFEARLTNKAFMQRWPRLTVAAD